MFLRGFGRGSQGPNEQLFGATKQRPIRTGQLYGLGSDGAEREG